MAEEKVTAPTATDAVREEPSAPKQQNGPTRRKRSLKIDKDKVVNYFHELLVRDLWDRDEWNRRRLDRYAKLRGWLPEKLDPIGNLSSNIHMPIMLEASMRLRATLENALKSARPLMNAKAHQRHNVQKQSRIDNLIDYQVYAENPGERLFDDYVANYVDDGTVISFQKWVRRDDFFYDVRVLPQIPEGGPTEALETLFPDLLNATMKDQNGYSWTVEFNDKGIQRKAAVEFYDTDDGKLEAHLKMRATVFDGPSFEVQDIEDIVVPLRTGNLQPPSPENPHGAPYVIRLCAAGMDEFRQRKKDGTYDLLSDEDLDAIEASESVIYNSFSGGVTRTTQHKEEKDRQEGIVPTYRTDYDLKENMEVYAKWDVDGSGDQVHVIFTIARAAKKLCRARFLTEIYPGLPVRRPFSEARLFPVPNRFYGVSILELLESLQDSIKALMDQNLDGGTITNAPFGFYRASSGIEPEVIRMQPGELYPLADPANDIHFPTWNRDQSWYINTATYLRQDVERLSMMSDFSYGRVPFGKASALRTTGAAMSLLGQADVRAEQVLRRLFNGVAQIYQDFHRLNRRYLPREKELRVYGVPEQGEDAYQKLIRDEIDFDCDFEFKASLFNTNKQELQKALTEIAAVIMTPVAIQMGAVSPQEAYQLIRDMVKARDLDPDKYIKRPPSFGPRILAEEALSSILQGEYPIGSPLEAPMEHLQKLQAFHASDKFGFLNRHHVQMFDQYIAAVLRVVQEEQQKAAMMAAAAQTQAGLQGGGPTGQAQPRMMQEGPTPVGKGQLLDESLGPERIQ